MSDYGVNINDPESLIAAVIDSAPQAGRIMRALDNAGYIILRKEPAAVSPVIGYPGEGVRAQAMTKLDALGCVVIQRYAADRFRVGTFLPGLTTHVPGDAPKTEPEQCCWFDDVKWANWAFASYIQDAERNGWKKA